MRRTLDKRVLSWLWCALAFSTLSSASLFACLRWAGESSESALEGVGGLQAWTLLGPAHEDSWMPMVAAYQRKTRDPHADMYSVFFDDHVKFQYPPSSLLVLDLMPADVTGYVPSSPDIRSSARVEAFVTWPARLACLLAILCAAWLIELVLGQLAPDSPRSPAARVLRLGVACLLGLGFYPLLKSYELGQIQVFLNGAVALALLLRLQGWQRTSAVLLGLCCLVKPQYGVVALLALTTRQWRFLFAFSSTLLVGMTASLWRYGLHDHMRYLKVLRTIGRLGESYWPNQSVNGLLNRFLGNGDAVHFLENAFAPYRQSVYVTTTVSALVLLALALWPRRAAFAEYPAHSYRPTLALALGVAAATMASPVAWEHHYGSFLAIFALVLPGLAERRPAGAFTGPLLGLSYLAMSNALLRPSWLFVNRAVGLLGSHLFFGALILFGLVYVLRWPRACAAAAHTVHGGARSGVSRHVPEVPHSPLAVESTRTPVQ